MTPTPIFVASSTVQTSPVTSTALYSTTLTTLIVVGSVLFLATYLCALFTTYRYAQSRPRGLNRKSGVYLQRYAPAFYLFLVTSGLVDVSLSGWLLIQDAYLDNLPNVQSRRAVSLLLFCSCWTTLTSGAYCMLFIHPNWAQHNIASIGAQAIWLLLTLILWIVGTGLLNGALPQLLVKAQCGAIVNCGQIQGLFAVAVIIAITLTVGLAVLTWLTIGSPLRISLPRYRPEL